MRLARDQGKTLRELFAALSPHEFGYWLAFYDLSPPEEAADRRSALVSTSIWNASGHMKPGRGAKIEDFLQHKPRPRQSAEEQYQAFTRAIGPHGNT